MHSSAAVVVAIAVNVNVGIVIAAAMLMPCDCGRTTGISSFFRILAFAPRFADAVVSSDFPIVASMAVFPVVSAYASGPKEVQTV